jgi:hypothetical protein
MAECLHSKCEIHSSNPSTAKTKYFLSVFYFKIDIYVFEPNGVYYGGIYAKIFFFWY